MWWHKPVFLVTGGRELGLGFLNNVETVKTLRVLGNEWNEFALLDENKPFEGQGQFEETREYQVDER